MTGYRFARFEAPFELVSNVLSVGEARAVGPALGITMTGTVGLGGGEIDINGTVIPAYTINSLLGNIPDSRDAARGQRRRRSVRADLSGDRADP